MGSRLEARRGRTDRAIVLELDRLGWKTAPRKRTHEPRPFDANRVRLALASPVYAGQLVGRVHAADCDPSRKPCCGHRQEMVGAGAWEPYVSVEAFERIRLLRAERGHVARRSTSGRPPLGYLLAAGLGRCVCGARLDCVTDRHVRADGSRKRTYVCRTHRERPQDCAARPIDAATIDAAIIKNLEDLIGDVDDVRVRIAAGQQVDRERLEQEVKRAKVDADDADRRAARAKRIAMDAEDETAAAAMDVYAEHRADADRARARLNAALDALDAPEAEADIGVFYERLHAEIAGRIGGAGDDVRRLNAALSDLFESFTLTPTEGGHVIRPALSPDAAARILRDADLVAAPGRGGLRRRAPHRARRGDDPGGHQGPGARRRRRRARRDPRAGAGAGNPHSSFVKTRVGSDASVRSERELLLRQIHRRRPQTHHAARDGVDLQRTDAQAPGAPARVGATQQRPHARAQLRVAERLGQT